MTLIAIDRKTGMRANEGGAGTIMEAFKPGTGTCRQLLGHRHGCRRRGGEAISPSASRAIQTGGAASTRKNQFGRDAGAYAARALAMPHDLRQQGERLRSSLPFLYLRFTGRAASLWSAPIQNSP
jgi:hypothetical protein